MIFDTLYITPCGVEEVFENWCVPSITWYIDARVGYRKFTSSGIIRSVPLKEKLNFSWAIQWATLRIVYRSIRVPAQSNDKKTGIVKVSLKV